jgi:two-component system OmpR family response regulator
MKILLVEDEPTVASFIQKGLVDNGHSVQHADKGGEGLKLASTGDFDVVILDRMLPEMDGLEILSNYREQGVNTPTLILSAKNKVDDKVTGLRAGADDYLTKPFAFEELLARVEILNARNASTAPSETSMTLGELHLDLINRKVTRDEQVIDLQSKEFKLLEYLMHNPNKIVTRAMLLEKVWEYNFDPQTNVIDVHISRLRNKIDKGFDYPMIETIRGAGYMISSR